MLCDFPRPPRTASGTARPLSRAVFGGIPLHGGVVWVAVLVVRSIGSRCRYLARFGGTQPSSAFLLPLATSSVASRRSDLTRGMVKALEWLRIDNEYGRSSLWELIVFARNSNVLKTDTHLKDGCSSVAATRSWLYLRPSMCTVAIAVT
ncbi:hypothetical protein DFH06DRAFT_1303261 [Mycena polygramma]|nr:hypothetical protein DFH06DRAFT_1303261 [Mycena polygramma]